MTNLYEHPGIMSVRWVLFSNHKIQYLVSNFQFIVEEKDTGLFFSWI